MAYNIIRPRRGIKSLWEQYKGRVYKQGEMLVESPETGVGSGPVNVKFGDGVTDYEHLPYAIMAPTDEVIQGSKAPISSEAAMKFFLPLSGGTLSGALTAKSYVTAQSDTRVISVHVDGNGNGGVYDVTNDKWLLWSDVSGTSVNIPVKLNIGDDLTTTRLYLANKKANVNGGADCINLNTESPNYNGRYLNLYNDTGKPDIKEALQLLDYNASSGTWSTKNIFGDHNKPFGSYVGNAIARTISTGGTGRAVLLYPSTKTAALLITPKGAFGFVNTTSACYSYDSSKIYYVDGELHIDTAHEMMNESGTTYYYQVL